jgi:hypothetical protein
MQTDLDPHSRLTRNLTGLFVSPARTLSSGSVLRCPHPRLGQAFSLWRKSYKWKVMTTLPRRLHDAKSLLDRTTVPITANIYWATDQCGKSRADHLDGYLPTDAT